MQLDPTTDDTAALGRLTGLAQAMSAATTGRLQVTKQAGLWAVLTAPPVNPGSDGEPRVVGLFGVEADAHLYAAVGQHLGALLLTLADLLRSHPAAGADPCPRDGQPRPCHVRRVIIRNLGGQTPVRTAAEFGPDGGPVTGPG